MQSCIICLEEGANLKQLNHCGVYYVHKKCHSKWNSKNNTCIVCREQIVNEHTIIVQEGQVEEQRYYYRVINTLQFKVVYTIIVIIMTLTTAFIFFIW
jgi:hypothetical protein